MIPFALLGGIAVLLFLSSRRSTPKKELSGTVYAVDAKRIPTVSSGVNADVSYLKKLGAIRVLTRVGKPIPTALLDDVITEAYDRGDWKVVSVLTPKTSIGESEPEPESEPVASVEGELSDDAPMDASKPIGKSPIDGADAEEWQEFIGKFRTQSPTYATEKHVGAFHHNRERLTQLGYDAAALTDEATQAKAIADDLVKYRQTERKLIDDFGGDLLTIDGVVHPVTMSGVLGVLKAAGPKHARSWFRNEEERKQFPHTTETFLRANGIF